MQGRLGIFIQPEVEWLNLIRCGDGHSFRSCLEGAIQTNGETHGENISTAASSDNYVLSSWVKERFPNSSDWSLDVKGCWTNLLIYWW